MYFDNAKINAKGRLNHLQSADLFYNGYKQIFNAKNGKYLGLVAACQAFNFEEPEDPEIEPAPEPINEMQLSLF